MHPIQHTCLIVQVGNIDAQLWRICGMTKRCSVESVQTQDSLCPMCSRVFMACKFLCFGKLMKRSLGKLLHNLCLGSSKFIQTEYVGNYVGLHYSHWCMNIGVDLSFKCRSSFWPKCILTKMGTSLVFTFKRELACCLYCFIYFLFPSCSML